MPQPQVPVYQAPPSGYVPVKKTKGWIPFVVLAGVVFFIFIVVLVAVFAVKSLNPQKRATAAASEAANLIEKGDYDSAFSKYDEAVMLDSDNVTLIRDYAQALMDRGQYSKAKDVLNNGIEKTDSNILKRLLDKLEKGEGSKVDDGGSGKTRPDASGSELTTTSEKPEESTTTTTTKATTTTTALDKKPMYEAYKKFLADKKKKFKSYKSYTKLTYSEDEGWSIDYEENKSPIQVDLIDVTGDDLPELFCITEGDNELSFDLTVYSFIDGKMKNVLQIKNIDVQAGGHSDFIVCKSKNKGELLIYLGRFDETSSEAYTTYKWDGKKFASKATFGNITEFAGDDLKINYSKGKDKISQEEYDKLVNEFGKTASKILLFNAPLDDAMTKTYFKDGGKPHGTTYDKAVKNVDKKLKEA